MNILGHKKLERTYYYIRVYNQVYKPQQPYAYVTKIASTKEQRIELINDGWELVNQDYEDWKQSRDFDYGFYNADVSTNKMMASKPANAAILQAAGNQVENQLKNALQPADGG